MVLLPWSYPEVQIQSHVLSTANFYSSHGLENLLNLHIEMSKNEQPERRNLQHGGNESAGSLDVLSILDKFACNHAFSMIFFTVTP
jgi:hypothetical protein